MATRTNKESCRAKCKLICNTAYVDTDVLTDLLLDNNIDPEAEPIDNGADLMRCAILIVKGWVETSRSEGGISTGIDLESVKQNIMFWCGQYDLDSEEFFDDALGLVRAGDLPFKL